MYSLANYTRFFVPIFSIITAIAVFGYLHKLRAASFISALPITKRCLYITNWLSGLTLILGPVLLIGLFYGALLAVMPVASGHFLLWLGFMVISHLLFFSMAVIVTFLTGNRIMQVFLYVLANFISYVLYGLVLSVLNNLVFRLPPTTQALPLAVQLLTPTYAVGNTISRVTPMSGLLDTPNVALTWGIYLAAAALQAVLGYFMYRARKIESAGNMIVHKPMRSAFVYLIGFLFGALISYILMGTWIWRVHLSTLDIIARLTVSMVIFGSLGCLFSQMLIQKQLRVTKAARKSIVVFAAVIILIAAFFAFDVPGFVRRIPNLDDVAAVSQGT
jgi:ABC-2 type transport system permease protein